MTNMDDEDFDLDDLDDIDGLDDWDDVDGFDGDDESYVEGLSLRASAPEVDPNFSSRQVNKNFMKKYFYVVLLFVIGAFALLFWWGQSSTKRLNNIARPGANVAQNTKQDADSSTVVDVTDLSPVDVSIAADETQNFETDDLPMPIPIDSGAMEDALNTADNSQVVDTVVSNAGDALPKSRGDVLTPLPISNPTLYVAPDKQDMADRLPAVVEANASNAIEDMGRVDDTASNLTRRSTNIAPAPDMSVNANMNAVDANEFEAYSTKVSKNFERFDQQLSSMNEAFSTSLKNMEARLERVASQERQDVGVTSDIKNLSIMIAQMQEQLQQISENSRQTVSAPIATKEVASKKVVSSEVASKEPVAVEKTVSPPAPVIEREVKALPIMEPKSPAPIAKVAVAPAPVKTVKKTATRKRKTPRKQTIRWELRSAQPGKAVVARKGGNDLQTVEVGNTLSGIGRVKSVSMVGGKWVVQGTTGSITH